MPKKLPAEALSKLQAVLATGKLPEYGEPGSDVVGDAWGNLGWLFDGSWADPKESVARRHVGALMEFWGNICCDGLSTGVACNEPNLAHAAYEAAAAMGLKTATPLLAEAAKCVPAEVLRIDDPWERSEWYASPQGQPLEEKLGEIEERFEPECLEELQFAIFRRILAEPAEFFES